MDEIPTEPSTARAQQARQTMYALTASPNLFETFFDEAHVGLALADLSGQYVRVNRAYAALLGRAPEDLIGVPLSEVLHPDDGSGTGLAALLGGTAPTLQAEQRYVAPDGQWLWVLHGVTVVPGPDGAPAWLAVSAQDITERRHAEEELRALTATLAERAVRDPLTGLANRSLLEERLRAVLTRDVRTGASTALLFLDLDGFKSVNDLHGHAVGDIVLRTVGERLTSAVRPSDTVARLGGDEFVVLLEGTSDAAVGALVARLTTAVKEPIGTLDLEVGVSVGVAVSHAGEADPGGLLNAADRDMYAAKRRASR